MKRPVFMDFPVKQCVNEHGSMSPMEKHIDALPSTHSTKFPLVRMRTTLRPHGILGDE